MPARSAAFPSCTLRTSCWVNTRSRPVRLAIPGTSTASGWRVRSPRRSRGCDSGGANAPSMPTKPAPTSAVTAEITPEPHSPTGRRSRSPSSGIAAQRIAPPGSIQTRSIAPGAARTPQAMCAPSYTGPVAQEVAVSTPFFASTTSPLVPMSTNRLLPR